MSSRVHIALEMLLARQFDIDLTIDPIVDHLAPGGARTGSNYTNVTNDPQMMGLLKAFAVNSRLPALHGEPFAQDWLDPGVHIHMYSCLSLTWSL